ncbi:uncharacterized protein LTR77_007346 [Saxophila tyrrhenica]|uniref:PNPLA domain-containing protein n=1 Tax=Saxophila tyrrhenica TaxID=1690608 RepID=A0AAV9P7E0_9PEZI|nr:hypothetical protein LTR77_007346 [Saxophila tyrrhenica]
MASSSKPHNLRILSLDGGGIKGYTTLLILRRLMRNLSHEMGETEADVRPCHIFDLIVGTSTSGLIAVMLGRLQMTVDECISAYEQVGRRVFGRPPALGAVGKIVKGFASSAFYSVEALQAEIKTILGDRNFPASTSFRVDGKPPCKVMLCVTTATAKPEVLRSYTATASTAENYDCTIWEAASATSAAPIYFKPVRFEAGKHEFSDGGLHFNNPVNEALAELSRDPELKGRKVGCLVSIGTGSTKITPVSKNLASFLKKAVEMLTDSERIADDFARSSVGRELSDQDRYFRFNVPQGMEDLQLDDYKATERMQALTTLYLSKAGSGREIERCTASLMNPDRSMDAHIGNIPSVLPRQAHEHFVERPTYTNLLRRFFHVKSDAGQVKSQIALDFGNMVKTSMPVFWVRADMLTNFASDYRTISGRLSPTEATTESIPMMQSLDHTRRQLEQLKHECLLILDNADDLDDFLNLSDVSTAINTYIPRNCRVLITTRDPRFVGGYAAADHGVQVKPMSPEEAARLLFKSVPRHLAQTVTDETAEDVQELLEALGCLPLAVAQAAANIRDQQLSILQYSRAYRDKERRMGLMRMPVRDLSNPAPRSAAQSILVTWEMSFDVLSRRDPLSAACLNYMGFFDHRGIPHGLLMRLPEFIEMGPGEEQNVVSRLLRLSLIEEVYGHTDIREYNLHPVVHERILKRLKPHETSRYGKEVALVLREVFPEPDDASDLTGTDLSLARYLFRHNLSFIPSATSFGVRCMPLVFLMQLTADFLRQLGFTGMSVELARQCMDEAQHVWSGDDVNIFWCLTTKMDCLAADAGDAYCDEILSDCDLVGDSILSSDLARSQLSNSGIDKVWMQLLDFRTHSLFHLGLYEEQLFLSQLQLIRLESVTSEDFERAIRYKHDIANLLNHFGKIDEAEMLCDSLLLELEGPRQAEIPTYLKVSVLRGKAACLERRWYMQVPLIRPTHSTHLQNAMTLSLRACQLAMTLGVSDIIGWDAVGEGFLWLVRLNRVTEAMAIASGPLERLAQENVHAEGALFRQIENFLLVVKGTVSHPLLAESSAGTYLLRLVHDASKLHEINLAQLDHTADPSFFQLFVQGIECGELGRHLAAEDAHRKALQYLDGRKSLLGLILHYNIMLAIARQPGRLEDALEYRRSHLSDIEPAEHIYGTLEACLALDEADRAVYRRAIEQQHSQRGGTLVWTDAEAAGLARAIKRYGPLENGVMPPGPSAQEPTSSHSSRIRLPERIRKTVQGKSKHQQ